MEEEIEDKTIEEEEFIKTFERKTKEIVNKNVKQYRKNTMDAYSKHVQFMESYLKFYGGDQKLKQLIKEREENFQNNFKSDMDLIKQEYKFIVDEEDDFDSTWEKRLTKKYYDRLFKEYCLADLSKYKEKKIGMRWRIESEVIKGKGQFICGNIKCEEENEISTHEVNFEYLENGEEKQALVKLRLCKKCGKKLKKINGKRKREKENESSEKFLDDLFL
jgi:protein FRA10AC1